MRTAGNASVRLDSATISVVVDPLLIGRSPGSGHATVWQVGENTTPQGGNLPLVELAALHGLAFTRSSLRAAEAGDMPVVMLSCLRHLQLLAVCAMTSPAWSTTLRGIPWIAIQASWERGPLKVECTMRLLSAGPGSY